MKDISLNIKDRVIQFAKKEEDTVQSFFKKTGLKYGNFTGKSKKSDLGSKFIAEILLIYPNIDLYWLITGEKKKENYQEKGILKVEEETEDYLIDYEKKYNSLVDEYQLTNKENRELRKEIKVVQASFKNNSNTVLK